MSLKRINGALAQYLVPGKSPEIEIDGKVKPWDFNGTNRNRTTGANDRTGRMGWCYLGDGLETLTIGGAFSIDHIIADIDSGSGWVTDQDISGILSGRVLTFASGVYYKNIRAYVTAVDPANLRARYLAEEETGTTAFDQSDNGNDGTLSDASLHTQENSVLFSHANDNGFRLSGSVVVPILDDSMLCADGNEADYVGAYKPYIQIEASPAAEFGSSDTLTFSNSSPYTRPTAVTIFKSDGSVLGSYDSGSGVFTVTTGGRIDSLNVDGDEVFLCTGIGLIQLYKKDTVLYSISFSSVTWVTTNTNAVLQSLGGKYYGTIVETTGANIIDILSSSGLSSTLTETKVSEQGRTDIAKFTLNADASAVIANHNLNSATVNPDFTAVNFSNAYKRVSFDVFVPTQPDSLIFFFSAYYGAGVVSNGQSVSNGRGNTGSWTTLTFERNIDGSSGYERSGFLLSLIDGSGLIDTTGRFFYIDNWKEEIVNYLSSALDTTGNSTGKDVLNNPIPGAHLSGKALKLSLGNTLNRNPENIPALTQAGYTDTDSVTLEAFADWLGNIQPRERTSDLLTDITIYARPPQAKLVLDSTTDSNTIMFTAGSFAANGIVSATSGSGKTAITLGTDSITVSDGLELYYVRFLDASGDLVEIVPCHEGSGTEIKGIRGLLTGTIGGTTSAVWQTQNEFDAGLLFGEELNGGVLHPGKVNADFFPEGVSTRSGSTSIDNLTEALRGQRALKISNKAL